MSDQDDQDRLDAQLRATQMFIESLPHSKALGMRVIADRKSVV